MALFKYRNHRVVGMSRPYFPVGGTNFTGALPAQRTPNDTLLHSRMWPKFVFEWDDSNPPFVPEFWNQVQILVGIYWTPAAGTPSADLEGTDPNWVCIGQLLTGVASRVGASATATVTYEGPREGFESEGMRKGTGSGAQRPQVRVGVKVIDPTGSIQPDPGIFALRAYFSAFHYVLWGSSSPS